MTKGDGGSSVEDTDPNSGASPIPAGGRLVHIGPFKTGTTALQGAFHAARERLAEYGVIYPGRIRHPAMKPVLAMRNSKNLRGLAPPDPRLWQKFVREVAAAGDDKRVVISSEFLTSCDDSQIDQVVSDLGGSRVTVAVTLRSLVKILPSQWQAYVLNGSRVTPYETWLRRVLEPGPEDLAGSGGRDAKTFWARHDHPRLISRWAAVAGSQNVIVVIPDEGDPASLLRPFESVLDVPTETLQLVQGAANPSLSWGGIEMVRLISRHCRRQGWSGDEYGRVVRLGGNRRIHKWQKRHPDQPRIPTPAWARERAAELAVGMVERLNDLDVRIIGDPKSLIPRPTSAADERPAPEAPLLPADAAAQFAIGILSTAAPTSALPGPHIGHVGRELAHISTRDLIRVVANRVRTRLSRPRP